MEQFEKYLQNKNLSPETIKRYQTDTGTFMTWYGKTELLNCQKKDILNYLEHLNKKGMQTASRQRILIALRHYFDCLTAQNCLAVNPAALIKLRGVNKQRLNYIFDPEQLEGLLDTYYQLEVKRTQEKCQTSTTKLGLYPRQRACHAKMRNYAMLQFFVYQGLRTREVLALQTGDLQLDKAKVNIRKGATGGNARVLNLQATQIGTLMQYLDRVRPQLEADIPSPDSSLFLPVYKNSPKIKKGTTSPGFKTLVKQLKSYNKNFTGLAQLRASVITQWIQNYGLRRAQYMAGHKSIVSTEEYVPNSTKDLAEDITRFNPF